ncbi:MULTISPECIES: hypothetical protein [Fischerella]|nr:MULTISPECIES: hypothetical protein [Fischerella]MBD2434546.1 hypothetical protein [Fischerella sp. FACHB-380]
MIFEKTPYTPHTPHTPHLPTAPNPHDRQGVGGGEFPTSPLPKVLR